MPRKDGRKSDQARNILIEPGYVKYPHGSVLITWGETKVLCTACVDERVPPFLRDRSEPQGWLTAEYALLPGSGLSRSSRAGYGPNQVKGRVHEIQRLIGRSLRATLDMKKLGERTISIDCDVIQADGGTRTASVTGSMIALELAISKLVLDKKLVENPLISQVAAISLGVVRNEVLLDLNYLEDSSAETDLNLVMTRDGGFVEIQSTAEKGVFSRGQLDEMLRIGSAKLRDIFSIYDTVLGKKA